MGDEVVDNQLHLLYDISKEVKQFYETPVIFFTKKDYSDGIFNTLCTFRNHLADDSKKELMNDIVDFHLQWLHAVNEIENFKKVIPEIARDEIYQAVSYTIDAMASRLKYFNIYLEKNIIKLPNADQLNLNAELEIVEGMHAEVTHSLLEKLKCFRNFTGDSEFILKVKQATDELLKWLDKSNDSLSIVLSNYVNWHVSSLSEDLIKTLQDIVDELETSKSPKVQNLISSLKERGEAIGFMIRCTAGHDVEINTVLEKIQILNDRITLLENEKLSSAAIMALSNKKEYLEKRLNSIEKLKTTIKNLHNSADEEVGEETCVCEDFFQLRIFNHALPVEDREKLVTKLCALWDTAIFGVKGDKSIISILSAADVKQEFKDDLGTYTIDQYSRKVYKIPESDTLYQPNEVNQLVPLSDDAEHVYFYDECGRYFIDSKTKQRVYKAHASASEFMMASSGVLLKIAEERDGIRYHYDNFGRYYINQEGKRIYRDPDSISEYEYDGLGNLVRIRSQTDLFMPCPEDENVTEDFNYLKLNVGEALRVCIAECVLIQPPDPIKYLSTRLIKYRENIEAHNKRSTEHDELQLEREFIAAQERAAAEKAAYEAALLAQGGSETSYDSNLMNYKPQYSIDSRES